MQKLQEVLVKRNGKIASYQRFFTPKELKEWVENELGDEYSVEVANESNSGTKGLAAVVVTKDTTLNTREGNGVATDNDVVMAVDPVSKVLGSPRGTAQQRKASHTLSAAISMRIIISFWHKKIIFA